MKKENKIAHLQMIQDVISRMATNTFLIKGWSITAIGALFYSWILNSNHSILFLTLCLLIFFWIHDAYYLHLERAFRNQYEEVIKMEEKDINFEVEPVFKEKFTCTLVRPILIYSYLTLVIINLVLIYMTK